LSFSSEPTPPATTRTTVVWNATSVSVASHAFLLSAAVAAWTRESPYPWIALAVSLVGLLSATFWCVLIDRQLRLLVTEENVSRQLELALKIGQDYALTWERGHEPDTMRGSLPAKPTLRRFSIIAVAGWAVTVCLAVAQFEGPVTLVTVSAIVLLSVAATIGVVTNAIGSVRRSWR
jgi:hypothetical protein